MKMIRRFSLIILILLTGSLFVGTDVPYLSGRVNDYAQILSSSTRQSLTALLKAHEDQTTNQIAILTIPTLEGEPIEDYAIRVFDEWKLGQKGKDNGILIIVAPEDRRLRIEVGYGLEPVLTDGTAGQIIQNIMTPKFKKGDFDGGVTDGAKAVMAVVEGSDLSEMIPELNPLDKVESAFDGPEMPLKERILIGAFIFTIIGIFTLTGITTPGVGWFLYFFLIPFWAMFPIFIIGVRGAFICLVTYLIVFPVAKLICMHTKWYKKAKKDLKRKGRASIGGFRFSTRSSGRSWSSGGSSFSGGGGSSGGGGASGSW